MEERPVSHRSDADGLLRQWKKWRRRRARVAVPTSPTCPRGGRMRRVPKPKPRSNSAGEERVAGGGGGLLPPAVWYDLRCTECECETTRGGRPRKPACWAADWKATRPRRRRRSDPSFADMSAAFGDLRLSGGDDDHSSDVDGDMISVLSKIM